MQGLAVGAIVTVMSLLFFTDLNIQHPLLTFLIIILTSAVFSLAGFINAVFANSFDDISIIPTFALNAINLLRWCLLFSTIITNILALVSGLNPIFYMVNAFRYGFLGASDVSVTWAFIILGVFTVGLYVGCIWLLRSGKGIRT